MTAVTTPVAVLPFAGLVAQTFDEFGGGRVVGSGLGDDLDESGVSVGVGRGERDEFDAGDGFDLLLQVVHEAERIGGVDDLGGDDEGSVVAGAEGVGGEVVGDAFGRSGGVLARVGQRQLQVFGRDAEGTESDDDDHDGHPRPFRRGRDPPAEEAAFRRGARAGCPGFGAEPFAGEAHEGGQHRHGDEHRQRHSDGGEDAHDGEERDSGDGQTHERNDAREPGEHDRRSGGGERTGGGFLGAVAFGELLTVAREDEQGVVDPDREPEHDRQHRRGGGDGHESGRQHHDDPGHGDAHERGDDGHPGGDHGPERHHEHDERHEHAEHFDDRQAGDLHRERLASHGDAGSGGEFGLDPVGRVEKGLEDFLAFNDGIDVERDIDHRGGVVVVDESIDHVVVGGGHVVDEGDVLNTMQLRFDSFAVFGRINTGPLRGDDHHVRGGARDLREGHVELVERSLGGRAGDFEVFVEALIHHCGECGQHDRHGQPGQHDASAHAVAPASEPVEQRRHASTPFDTFVYPIRKCIR